MTSVFSWQNSVSLWPASFCTPRPNLPVPPGISSSMMKRTHLHGSQPCHVKGAMNSVKPWAMPCRATQNRQVRIKSSNKMWSTRGGNGKPLQYSCKLKWTGMGEFNSDDHYIYYCGQESLRRNGVALIVDKRVWNAVLGCNFKNNRMISVHFQGKPFNITVIQVIPLPLMLKKLKLNSSMKTYKTF